ncbi:MAG TPA: DUF2752 domain-containing protein [Armatimonadota bacterium]|jgi:hypothetical protein
MSTNPPIEAKDVRKRVRATVALLSGAVYLALAALRAGLPAEGALAQAWARVPCPWAAATGWPCPLCGITRASALLLRGEVRASLECHPLGGLALLIAAGAVVYGVRAFFGRGAKD